MKITLRYLLTLSLSALILAALAIPVAADAIVEPSYDVFTPAGAITAALLVAGVVLVTVLLIRCFFAKKRHDRNRK